MTFSKKSRAVAGTLAAMTFLLSGSQSIGITTESQTSTTEQVEPETKYVWVGENFTETETRVLKFLQEQGITDRAALATILGNIKQESKFDTKVCEGGKKTGYGDCIRGGFGLIQWTTVARYQGLGNYARINKLCPNSLEAQLGWMVTEVEWKKVEHIWKTPGNTIEGYMGAAKKWLGWGVHGKRTVYSYQYYDTLSQQSVTTETLDVDVTP